MTDRSASACSSNRDGNQDHPQASGASPWAAGMGAMSKVIAELATSLSSLRHEHQALADRVGSREEAAMTAAMTSNKLERADPDESLKESSQDHSFALSELRDELRHVAQRVGLLQARVDTSMATKTALERLAVQQQRVWKLAERTSERLEQVAKRVEVVATNVVELMSTKASKPVSAAMVSYEVDSVASHPSIQAAIESMELFKRSVSEDFFAFREYITNAVDARQRADVVEQAVGICARDVGGKEQPGLQTPQHSPKCGQHVSSPSEEERRHRRLDEERFVGRVNLIVAENSQRTLSVVESDRVADRHEIELLHSAVASIVERLDRLGGDRDLYSVDRRRVTGTASATAPADR